MKTQKKKTERKRLSNLIMLTFKTSVYWNMSSKWKDKSQTERRYLQHTIDKGLGSGVYF